MTYENIPPERELEYINNADGAIQEATSDLASDMALAAETWSELHPGVVQEAESIRDEDDIATNFDETIEAATGGVPGLVAAGRATLSDIADYGNRRLAQGFSPEEVDSELKTMQTKWMDILGKVAKGTATEEDLEKYRHDLSDTGMSADLVEKLVYRARHPEIIKTPWQK